MPELDLKALRTLLEADRVELAMESEFKEMFPDCELGAMPPFGNLYGMDVYVEEDLAAHEYITFNAGSHTELIEMRYQVFEDLVQPRLLHAAIG